MTSILALCQCSICKEQLTIEDLSREDFLGVCSECEKRFNEDENDNRK